MKKTKKQLKYIDLFAGLGGFHIGLKKLGHKCVFASEKKEILAELYDNNFDIKPNRDITSISPEDVPKHDILCAGFPCQPFSKAGDQKGLDDERNGNLFYSIFDILRYHKPKYFILENVANLEKHDSGNTWEAIYELLVRGLGYTVDKKIISPHEVGIPQHRQRLFIVGSKNGLDHFQWPKKNTNELDIESFLDKSPKIIPLEDEKKYVLSLWQDFIDKLPISTSLPSWPIWSMEFGATYPFEETTPYYSSSKKLGMCNGSFGIPLKGLSREEKFHQLPSYARVEQFEFPRWKKHFIRSNREFYQKNRKYIESPLRKIKKLEAQSWQKFEWNIKDGERNISKHLVQFRGSGVRIKRFDYFPSLVTVSTQIPIIAKQERYLTPKEGARIQSLNGIKLPKNIGTCFSALGNAVNAKIVTLIAKSLINE